MCVQVIGGYVVKMSACGGCASVSAGSVKCERRGCTRGVKHKHRDAPTREREWSAGETREYRECARVK